jgi:solute carrier family 13 (sodium-dependent dicarboxylate transporter), member 2/3/5
MQTSSIVSQGATADVIGQTAAPPQPEAGSARRAWFGMLAGLVAFLLVWFAPLGIQPKAQHAFAILALMVVLWITEVVDHGITAWIGCYLFWLLGVAEFRTAFSGFVQDTPWFLYSALLIAAAASKTGLAQRIAYGLMSVVGTSFPRLFLGVITMSFVLNFFVPSGMAQLAALVPILAGLVAAFGLPPRSNIGRSLFTTLACISGLFNKMVLAGAASLLARGLIENITHVRVYWSQWLVAFLPAIPLTIFAVWRAVLWLYPPEETERSRGRDFLKEGLQKLGPWSANEKKSLLFGILALALWSTDRIHHASPALVGIGVALLLCLPKIGVLRSQDIKQVNFLPILFVGGVLSMSTVLLETGALQVLTGLMSRFLGPLFSNFTEATVVLYWSAFVYHLFLGSELSMLSTSLPAVIQFATERGLNPLASGLVWTFAASGQVFVYQSAVLILGYSYGYFEPKDLLKIGGTLAVIEFLILLLVVSFYWPFLGLA